jgi:hypothetical protein
MIARFALAALAAMAFLLVVNVVVYPWVFPNGPPEIYRYERTEPLAVFRLLAMLVTSVLFAYIFPIGYRGKTPWAEGLRFGMWMGALAGLPWSLNVYAQTDTGFSGLLTAVLWTVITYGIAGSLVGAAYGNALRDRRG